MDPAEAPVDHKNPLPAAKPWLEQSRTWTLAWLGWFTVLCILSSTSQPGPKINVVGIDKVEHAVYFALGGTLLLLAITLRGKTARGALDHTQWGKLAALVFLAGATVGWVDEWHQTYTPGRSGLDLYDWIADVTGSLAALPLARLMLRRLADRAERACRRTGGTA